VSDWNDTIIEEFRANDGAVEAFGGKNLVLLHHVGRNSGKQFVSPVAGFPVPGDPGAVRVVASKGGAPDNPQWYFNLVGAGTVTVEGPDHDTYQATVRELTGAERDEAYRLVVEKMPGFGDYEKKTAGIRTIPVLELHRV
jgi:deazaflavin-dependent oxidoreductase (nitroreductase family)